MTGFPPFWAAYQAWRPEFAKAIDETLHPLDWLDGEVWSGNAMFDHAEDAAILSEWKPYPSGAFDVHGLVAAGSLDTIRHVLIPRVNERARLAGARGSIISSRPAWAKILHDDGYDIHQIEIRKAL